MYYSNQLAAFSKNSKQQFMTSITDENGIINNFPEEPKMYYAKAPSTKEQRRYVFWGVVASFVVATFVSTAVFVS